MVDYVSVGIASASLVISAATLWWTTLHRGTLKMTQPGMVYFGPDGQAGMPKVTLRPMLYSTSRRGQVLEGLYVKLHRGDSWQAFNIWVHGDGPLVRGGGMKVGWDGVVCYHHFLLPKDGAEFEFRPGTYRLEVFARLVNVVKPLKVFDSHLAITKEQAAEMKEKGRGLYFDWDPDSSAYYSHLDSKRDDPDAEMIELLTRLAGSRVGPPRRRQDSVHP
jgi:hypothetical protein